MNTYMNLSSALPVDRHMQPRSKGSVPWNTGSVFPSERRVSTLWAWIYFKTCQFDGIWPELIFDWSWYQHRLFNSTLLCDQIINARRLFIYFWNHTPSLHVHPFNVDSGVAASHLQIKASQNFVPLFFFPPELHIKAWPQNYPKLQARRRMEACPLSALFLVFKKNLPPPAAIMYVWPGHKSRALRISSQFSMWVSQYLAACNSSRGSAHVN